MERIFFRGNQVCPGDDELQRCLSPLSQIDPSLERHLSQCGKCQQSITHLAGEAQQWQEAAAHLSRPRDNAAFRVAQSVCALFDSSAPDGGPAASAALPWEGSLTAHELQSLRSGLAPPSHPELLGRLGRYELEQLIGRGGMGFVFRGRDTELHRVVAVKTIAAHLNPSGAARERFVREARACASLTHPHIVAVHDVITDEDIPAIVMQYVAGPTLAEHLEKVGRMHWSDVLPLAIQLADALSLAHENGLVHRDIKPGNVLLEAGGSRALLTDFGLVRALDDATITHTGTLTGTPEYMSPEQARGLAVDGRSDLFSFGSLLYSMLAGHSPFRAPEPMATLNRVCHEPHRPLNQKVEGLPVEIARLVDRLLDKDPNRRIASAGELRQRLQTLHRSDLHLSRPRVNRKRLLMGSGAAVVAASLLGLGSCFMDKPQFSSGEKPGRGAAASAHSEAQQALVAGTDASSTGVPPTQDDPRHPDAVSLASERFAELDEVQSRIELEQAAVRRLADQCQTASPERLEQLMQPPLDLSQALEALHYQLNRLEDEMR